VSYAAVLLRDPCVYCGNPATGLDHIHPSVKGGTDGWTNRAPACASCDSRKGDTPLVHFLHRQPLWSRVTTPPPIRLSRRRLLRTKLNPPVVTMSRGVVRLHPARVRQIDLDTLSPFE
jgi:hypothetical protein